MSITRNGRASRCLILALSVGLLAGCGGNKKSSSASSSSTAAATSNATTPPATSASGTSGTAAPGSNTLAAPSSGSAVAALAPTLASISPTQGPLDGGTPLTITGTNFLAAGSGETLVVIGSQAVLVTPLSDTEIQLSAPRGTVPQAEDVRVVNDLGMGRLSAAFSYAPRPATLSFEPVVGHHELGLGGTKITIDLSEAAPLTNAAIVRFGAIDATTISFVDSDTIVAEVPQGVVASLTDVSVEDMGVTISAPGFKVQDALAYGDLIVNEFCAHPGGVDFNRDGYGDSKADEFVEIVNTTQEWVDLSYLTIWDGANRERHRFLNPTVLPPGGAIVVFGSGTPDGFALRGESGHAQASVADELGLNNTNDTIEIRTQPGLNPVGETLFKVEYTSPPSGGSFTNLNDGQKILLNPATAADYEYHSTAPGAVGEASPGTRKDGSKF